MNLFALVLSIIFFVIALILRLASVSKGVFLTPDTFEICGFISLAVSFLPWGSGILARRPAPPAA